MMPTTERSVGTVSVAGNYLHVTFAHQIQVAHAVRQVGGQRLSLGDWKVPLENGPELARKLARFEFDWCDGAERFLTAELDAAAAWSSEQSAALAIKAGDFVLDPEPPIDLLAHQRQGAAFLAARSGALLADEQGLGKTVTCLAAYWMVRSHDPQVRLVVVCPNSLKRNWEAEARRFFPEWTVEVVSGSAAHRRRSYTERADIYVVNYESARSDYAQLRLLLRRRPAIVVCDEAHALKNKESQTTRAAALLRPAAARMWLMTGTPVPNTVEDIYSQATLADEGRLLGTIQAFRSRFGGAADDSNQLLDLQRTLDPLVLRRTKDEVLTLPDRSFEQRWVELSGAQMALYRETRDGLRSEVTGMSDDHYEASRQTVLVRLLRLSQIASNPRLVDPTFNGPIAKVQEVDDLLVQLVEENGRKVVLWSYYVDTIEEMLKRYGHLSPVAVYGAVDLARRADAVRRFQEDDSVRLFVGNPQAAGSGLTLTAAPYAIYETLTWRFDLYAQSLDRIHRIGQQHNVTYFEVLAANTIDETIRERLQTKKAFASALLGDPQSTPALSRSEVLDILSDRP